jgi:hypothetical protein
MSVGGSREATLRGEPSAGAAPELHLRSEEGVVTSDLVTRGMARGLAAEIVRDVAFALRTATAAAGAGADVVDVDRDGGRARGGPQDHGVPVSPRRRVATLVSAVGQLSVEAPGGEGMSRTKRFGRPSAAMLVAPALALALAPQAAAAQTANPYRVVIGGSDRDLVHDIAKDAAGNIYLVGETYSDDFPIVGGIQPTRRGTHDAFVVKLNPAGTQVIYSTFLGGSSFDAAYAVAADDAGNAYVTGYTQSADFPLKNALDANRGGFNDAFITKLNPEGNAILFSTYLGGNAEDNTQDIALDAGGNVYVIGRTRSESLLALNAAQPTYGGNEDAFVAKLNATLTSYAYVTYLGGSQLEIGFALDVSPSGQVCVAGRTDSTNLPVVNAPQATAGSTGDAFFAVLDSGGTAFTVVSYLGGAGSDTALGVSCTDTRLAIVGETQSQDFPTGSDGTATIQSTLGGETDGFLAAYSLTSVVPNREVATYVGGRRSDRLVDVAITGDVSAAGDTSSSGMPEVGGTPRGLTGAGTFRADADGTNWQPSGLLGIGINDLDRASSVPPRELAATDLGLYVSTDGGQTWVRQATGLPSRVVHTVDVNPTDACTWVIGVDSAASDPTPVGAARTTDCGVTWNPWGFPALRFLTIDWLGDPTRLVAQVSEVNPLSISTCVVNQDGNKVRCLGTTDTTSEIAVDPSDSCRFYVGTAFGGVQRVMQGGSGCNHPFSAQDTGANLGAPVTALAVVPDAGGTRIVAGTGDGKVIQSIPGIASGWTPLQNPVLIPYGVNTITATATTPPPSPSDGEAVVLFTTSEGKTFVTRYNVSTFTPPVELEGATSVSTIVADGHVLTGGAAGFRDFFTWKMDSQYRRTQASYSGTTCDDEVSAVAWDLIERLARTGITKRCLAQNRFGPGGKEDVAVELTTPPPPPCNASVALEVNTLDATGLDGGIVNFNNSGNCAVTPVSNAGWITVGKFNGAPGGAGWVDLLFERNTGPARTGTVTVGDQVLTVNQAAAPQPGQVQVRSADTSFSGDGGVGRASLSGLPPDALPSVEDSDWLRIVSGSSDGTESRIFYLVDENFSPTARSQTITFRSSAGVLASIVVTQAGATARCASPPAPSVSAPAAGGEVSITIQAPSGCQHTSRESNAAVGALAFAPGSAPGGPGVDGIGPGTLSFVVSANAGPGRTMPLEVAGYGLTVIQAAADAAVTHRANLAEGATSDFFDTQIALANPSPDRAVVATATFDTAQGQSFAESVLLFPLGRGTITPKTIPGLEQAEFATSIAADGPVATARLQTWDATGYGSHAEGGIPAPATVWYLAEGATHSGIDLFYLVQNPGDTPASVDVRYLRPGAAAPVAGAAVAAPLAPITRTYTVPPRSRFNIWVNQEGPDLAATDVSAVIASTNGVPIVVERAMYLSTQGRMFNAGHESAGITTPATQWFLAEGATGTYFDLFVLIANPTDQGAPITVRYLLTDGTVIEKPHVVAANSRYNIWVDLEDPRLADAAVSTTITSTNGVPVVVERAMWWPGGFATWHEAHNSTGATETGTRWAVAEGEAGGPRSAETYVLIANTSAYAGQARVTVMFEDGLPPVSRTYDLPPTSRTNVPIGIDFQEAAGRRFGVLVESLGTRPAQLVVEEAIYSDSGGVTWAAGANLLATRLP